MASTPWNCVALGVSRSLALEPLICAMGLRYLLRVSRQFVPGTASLRMDWLGTWKESPVCGSYHVWFEIIT